MRQLLNGAEVLLFRKSQVLGKTRLEKLAHYVAILLALVILISVILGNSLLFFHISSIDQFLNFLYALSSPSLDKKRIRFNSVFFYMAN